MENQEAPVKEGETYEVFIRSVGEKGDGITKVNGFVLFVPEVKKGDYVKIKITKVLTKFGFAKVLEKLEKPVRRSKFMEVNPNEMAEEVEEESRYEETDDFGADLEDDD